MTRSEPPRPVVGIIVGHDDLPDALARAAGSIIGSTDGLEVVPNPDLSTDELDSRLEDAFARHPGARVVVFIDMFGSSCAHAGIRLSRRHDEIALLCGVSLPMLVRFLQHRDRLEFAELVELLRRTAQEQTRPGPG